jgi:hypothetical protein
MKRDDLASLAERLDSKNLDLTRLTPPGERPFGSQGRREETRPAGEHSIAGGFTTERPASVDQELSQHRYEQERGTGSPLGEERSLFERAKDVIDGA